MKPVVWDWSWQAVCWKAGNFYPIFQGKCYPRYNTSRILKTAWVYGWLLILERFVASIFTRIFIIHIISSRFILVNIFLRSSFGWNIPVAYKKKINQFFLRSIANSHTLARLHCRGTRMDGMLELRCSYGNTILLQKCVWDNSETLTQQAWPCLRCVITLPAGLVTSYFSHVHLHPPLSYFTP